VAKRTDGNWSGIIVLQRNEKVRHMEDSQTSKGDKNKRESKRVENIKNIRKEREIKEDRKEKERKLQFCLTQQQCKSAPLEEIM
jgi:hypothetical protein